MQTDPAQIADRLIEAYDGAASLEPITASHPEFDVAAAYEVLRLVEERRRAQGWRPIGRKIGFTNRTIWERYGVFEPIWAHMWEHTVVFAESSRASLELGSFVEPRIEPEVVFKLRAPPAGRDDPPDVLECVEWIAPGFEIVQSHFPGWKFAAADCTAAFGLHGALIVGEPLAVGDSNRGTLAASLPAARVTLSRDGAVIDRGLGENVLGSPVLALVHLAKVLSRQPQFPALGAGEIVTTGTITDAWPVAPGETWTSDYGELGLDGLTVVFT